jgi:hypothetical protein
MNPRLRLAVWLATLLAGTGMLAGCVERRFIVTTDPPGAIVFDERDTPMGGRGASPTGQSFVYYGTYQFKVIAEGYETLIVREKVNAPIYEWFLLDFISENVIPWTIRDVRSFHYQLQRKQIVSPTDILQKAENLRQRGQGIGVPLPAAAGPPAVLGPPGPVSSAIFPPTP